MKSLPPVHSSKPSNLNGKTTILILAANPKGTSPLRLGDEVRDIENGLRRAQQRDRFHIEQRWATRPRDVQEAMLDVNPQIVHFCGHGAGDEGLVLENQVGQSQTVHGPALAGLFKLFADQVTCVLLNACHSQVQAEAIVQHIPYVIGMTQAIGDRMAVEYAIAFYNALGAGRTVQFAHDLGRNAIELAGLSGSLIPMLLQQATSRTTSAPDSAPDSGTESGVALSGEEGPGEHQPDDANGQKPAGKVARVFISYKRDRHPDETVALELNRVLGQTHEVAIDQAMRVGTKWQAWIDQQLQQSDFLIVLLSAESVQSEMVLREIQKSHKLAHHQGHPQILPVRLAYQAPFQYPLSEYLNDINWAFWRDETDTPDLIEELQKAIEGGTLSIHTETQKRDIVSFGEDSPADADDVVESATDRVVLSAPSPMAQPLELPEGTMDLESKFYVERSSDALALKTIRQQGVTITIKGPRQMGKSSLLIRIMNAARTCEHTKKVVFLDFQFFDRAALADGNLFYRRFCQWLSLKLRISDQTAEWWELYGSMGNPLTCTFYVQDYLLPEVDGPVLLAMDEVESTFASPFRTDFFAMLRGWHNSRATDPIWKQLDLALVTSTEPYQLIEDLNQSPFNVGQIVDLVDFSRDQVTALNHLHGLPLTPAQLERLMVLLHGHPFLVRRALYVVADGQLSVAQLFARQTDEGGPFGDHLRNHLSRIYDHNLLVQGLRQVFRRRQCDDEGVFFRLRGAGLVRREGRQVLPRCELYETYFQEHLRGGM